MRKRVFQPRADDDYEWINVHGSDADYEPFIELDGNPRGDAWTPLGVESVPMDERSSCKRSDFPWLSFCLILRRRAVDELRDLLDANGELLPLKPKDGSEMFAFNAQSIDAFDEERSTTVGGGEGMVIVKPVLRTSAIGREDVFRLPFRGSATFVSDRFVRRVAEAGLEGITFEEVELS